MRIFLMECTLLLVLGMAVCFTTCKSEATAQVAEKHSHNPEAILDSMGITLPVIAPPIANYVNVTQAGKLLFLAGKGPKDASGTYITGKLGKDLTVEEGYEAARKVGIMQIAVLKDHLGDLSKVKRILKVKGMVNATPDFTQHPEVINGFSDCMVEVFGDAGKHARAAVGMGSLPRNICVEIDMVVELH